MPSLEVLVLGPLEVARGAQRVTGFGYAKVRALLAYLAVESGQPHPRAHLCALLWPNQPEAASRRNLSQALTQLRRVLGEPTEAGRAGALLLTTTEAVQLNPEAGVSVDAARFAGLLETCEQHLHWDWPTCTPCAERQQAALDLYRGDFLSDLALPDSEPFDEWVLLWRERLRQRALSALERLAQWAEWRGAFGAAAGYARRQAELDPLNEAPYRAAMRLLALNGEPAAAGAQFERLRQTMARDLGLPPEPESLRLHEQIRAGARAELRQLEAPPYNGPEPPGTLWGRDEALPAVAAQLRAASTRALTLVGTPGIGKTRLALAVAFGLRFDFANGVHLVELAPVAEANGVPAAVALALGVKEQAGRPLAATVTAHLKDRHTLLVLDNCEHVLEAAAFVAELLAACPGVKVLATSRAPLRIRAEQAWPVPPLSPADAQQLFLERARLGGSELARTPESLATIAAICQRLDHLPLAIELIAVRARTLLPAELLRALDQPLQALTAAPRDLPPRHQTLRAAIAWSYDRLPAQTQAIFRHLGVFAGGATAEAVRAVAGAEAPMLPQLEALHEASLAQAVADDGATRFSLLETLRDFALEQLQARGEAEAAFRRHADYCLALARCAETEIVGAEQLQCFDRLEREHANLNAALAWCVAQAPADALRLAVRLEWFWDVRGYLAEGRRWLGEALAHAPEAPLPLRGTALAAAGKLALRQGDYPAGHDLTLQSLAAWQAAGDDHAVGRMLRHLGNVANSAGDMARAEAYYEQSLALARELGDTTSIAAGLNNMGLAAIDAGDYARARACYAECLPLFRQLDDRRGIGLALTNMGLVAWYELAFAEAETLLVQGLATFQEIGHKWGMALARLNLGNVARSQGEVDSAEAHFEASLTLYREVGDPASASYAIFGLGEVAHARGDHAAARRLYRQSLALRYEAGEVRPLARNLEALGQLERAAGRPAGAARLFGAAAGERERRGMAISPPERDEHRAEVDALRAALGPAAFEAAWEAGRGLSLEQAVALVPEDARP